MKRIDKAEVERVLKKGSLDEKLRIVIDDKVNRALYGKGIVNKKTIQELFDSVKEEDVELMEAKIAAINKVLRKRHDFELYSSKLDYLAEYINSGLERIDIYVCEAYLLNSLLEDIKAIKDELPNIYKQLYRRISLQKSIDKGIAFVYDKKSQAYKVDAHNLEKQIKIALHNFRYYLTKAKSLTLCLGKFAKDNLIEDLIPFNIMECVEGFQADYSRNKRFTAKHYRRLLADNSLESVLQAALMEDNGDTAFLFPDYEEIEINIDYINQLVVFK